MREVSGGLRLGAYYGARDNFFIPIVWSLFSPSARRARDYDDRATATRTATLPLVVRVRPVRRAVQLLRRPKHARGVDVQW